MVLLEEPGFRDRIQIFQDRWDAARRLAERLLPYRSPITVVLAIPVGGIPIGLVASERLNCPLDLMIARKIPIPWDKEAGYGAVACDGTYYLDEPFTRFLGLSREEMEEGIRRVLEEIRARNKLLRDGRPPPSVKGKDVILVDDGIAGGYTMMASVRWAKKNGCATITVAAPTASIKAVRLLEPYVSRVVCLNVRGMPFAVAEAYRDWRDISEEEALRLLKGVSPSSA